MLSLEFLGGLNIAQMTEHLESELSLGTHHGKQLREMVANDVLNVVCCDRSGLIIILIRIAAVA